MEDFKKAQGEILLYDAEQSEFLEFSNMKGTNWEKLRQRIFTH